MTMHKKHHYRELLSIGFPIIIGQLGTIILGFADTLMIGHHSTPELAAAGLVNNIFGLVFVSYMGFTYGLTPIIGRLYGEERTDVIGQKVRNSFLANMLTGGIFTLALILLYLNLAHIGQPEELLELIRPYFLVNLASVLFMGIFYTMKQFLDGIGQTKVAMWAMIGGNIVNILGNWVLIYGVAGFPELGLLGAGISTLASRILMALAMVGMVVTCRKFRTYSYDIVHSCVNRKDFKEMNRLGWPVALQLGMESAAFTLSCVMVGWLGTIPLAAHQVMITISQLFYLVLSGMAAAMAIRVSHFMGQKDYAAVRLNAYDGFRLNLLFSLCMGLPVLLLRHQIGGWFNDNVEVQAYVATLIILMMVYQFGDGLQYTFANALRGIACVKPMVLYVALKGQKLSISKLLPFQGDFCFLPTLPRAMPWAKSFCPFRAYGVNLVGSGHVGIISILNESYSATCSARSSTFSPSVGARVALKSVIPYLARILYHWRSFLMSLSCTRSRS